MLNHTVRGIGLMSGTSLDGLDIAYCEFVINGDNYQYKLLETGQIDFDDTWRTRLTHLIEQSAEIYAKTHVYFGHWLGKEVKQFIEERNIQPDFVASHGQTIFHQPNKNFTAQIGDGETMATYLPCLLITNFRNKDVALGGEGAPFIPIAEKYLFPDVDLFLNLGGFANMTYGHRAFDTSPCNIVLNFLTKNSPLNQLFDDNGSVARSGSFDPMLFDTLNQLSYFHQEPPKSLGWEWVLAEVLPILQTSELALEDILHTYVIHVAFQLAKAVEVLGAQGRNLLITGGGRHNGFLVEKIQEALDPLGIQLAEDMDQETIDYKEAIGFAFMGLRVLQGKPSNVASVTGASQDCIGGSVHFPPNYAFSLLPMISPEIPNVFE